MDAIARIELYNNLFYVFAGVAAISLVLAVVFFIRFDIPGIYSIMTGKTRKRSIQQIDERNSQTGKLRAEYPIPDESRTAKQSRTARTKKPATPSEKLRKSRQPEEKPRQAGSASVREQKMAAAETRPETQVLQRDTSQTTVLETENGTTEELARTTLLAPPPEFLFRITEQTVRVNTEEWI